MFTLIYILTLAAPSPAMTIDELADYQAHAEAALRLQAGEVEQAGMSIERPRWAFETPRTPVDLNAELAVIGASASPFASGAEPFDE